MAMSMLLRSQCNLKVATAALSNAARFSTLNTSRNAMKLSQNKNITQFAIPKLNILPAIKNTSIRQIATTAPRLSASGSHAGLWTLERAVSLAVLGILPAALLFPSKSLDTLLAVSAVMHAHWGLEAIVVDYVRPVIFGPVIPKIAPLLVVAFSAALLGGLLYLIYTDIGIANSVRKFWAIKGQ